MKALALCLVFVFVFPSCAGDKAILITGESLVSVGAQFRLVSTSMDAGYNSRKISAAQYDEWKAFGLKFQPAYANAMGLWDIAVATKDETMQRQAAALIMGLMSDLAGWAAIAGVKL